MSEKLLVPDIGEFEKVEVIELLVKVGDQIRFNDPVVTIESDKSSVEIPSTVSGKIESINVKVGDKVSMGDLLLKIEPSKQISSETPIPKDTESIIKQAESVLKKEEKEALLSVVSVALLQVNDYRKNEGAALEKDFNQRLEVLEKLLSEVIQIDPDRKEKVSLKLRNSLEQLTVEIDQNRMEQELIYYLEKYDITEEKVRLDNHLSYFKEIMSQNQPNGKKLGFISQEIGREINTIGSKANHSGLQKISYHKCLTRYFPAHLQRRFAAHHILQRRPSAAGIPPMRPFAPLAPLNFEPGI